MKNSLSYKTPGQKEFLKQLKKKDIPRLSDGYIVINMNGQDFIRLFKKPYLN